MKKLLIFALMTFWVMGTQAQPKSWTADNGNGTFTNPLFYDEFSDPDVIRVGDDYYLAGTTMHAVPGLVILHSKDLVNWEFASYCFDRFDFPEDKFALKNHQEIYGQGIWAPCIRYANGQFYVFSNINGKGLQCYTAKDIKGPWMHHNMQGNIYDLGVLFDDDGKIYAIHKYGEVHCTELKPDMSGPVEGSDRVIIPEGNGIGEGHHIYKIDGMYYLISTDYSPNGRTVCSRSKSIWGPYETRVIEADETYGYHGVGRTTVPRGTKYRIGEDGTKFGVAPASPDATGCDNAHQGGIVQAKDGSWWALFMQDFHSIGRTVCLMPMTWEDGWPMVGLKGNLGRAPRTWFKPGVEPGVQSVAVPQQQTERRAPYDRSDDFSGKTLKPVWQWNHNPDDKLWGLKGGKLRIQSQPADQLMWARNTLTQRVIGPKSIATVELYTKGMKDGDVCGLGNINVPCSWIGVSLPPTSSQRGGAKYTLRCFEQMTNDTVSVSVGLPNGKIWLRCIGDYDNNQMQYAYSTDGVNFQTLGRMMPLTYQLITFQGSRHALFAYNIKGTRGGYAEFDNFTIEEPCADRSGNIPYGKTIRIINKATGRPAIALKHGMLHDTHAGDKSELTQFKVIDRGQGMVALQCADGRYVKVYGDGLPGDVRFTADSKEAEVFLWQDYLDRDFMLLSLKNHKYLGKSPTTGSPYSWDYAGPDPARRNGSVLMWEEV
jgi:beta-xylosidase